MTSNEPMTKQKRAPNISRVASFSNESFSAQGDLKEMFRSTGVVFSDNKAEAPEGDASACGDTLVAALVELFGYEDLIEFLQLEDTIFALVFGTNLFSFDWRAAL